MVSETEFRDMFLELSDPYDGDITDSDKEELEGMDFKTLEDLVQTINREGDNFSFHEWLGEESSDDDDEAGDLAKQELVDVIKKKYNTD